MCVPVANKWMINLVHVSNMVTNEPGNQGKPGSGSFTLTSEGQFREFEKNASSQGSIREFVWLMRERSFSNLFYTGIW